MTTDIHVQNVQSGHFSLTSDINKEFAPRDLTLSGGFLSFGPSGDDCAEKSQQINSF